MFTGLISDIGVMQSVDNGRMKILCHYDARDIKLGASIACDGCCLTVIKCESTGENETIFDVDVSNETLECTTLGQWRKGYHVNLERSLCLGDELGGHIVSGHVDGVAKICDRQPDGESMRFSFTCPKDLSMFIAPKGSVSLNGTSLTVNEVENIVFGINLVPHTMSVTTWKDKKPGDSVNLEVDLLARYVARIGQGMGQVKV